MTIKSVLKGRRLRGFIMDTLRFLPDSMYIRLFYYASIGNWPDLKNPKGYNEKLQWLKLHQEKGMYSELVDKIKVREVIKERLGDGYTFPLLGKWKSFDEIDFSSLPDGFVMKCNHDSGSTKIVKSKTELTSERISELKKFYDRRVKYDFFYAGREPCYYGIDRYIIVEPLMSENGINDYKFFCFNGEPKVMLMVSGRFTNKHEDYFDMDGNWIELSNGSTMSPVCPSMPECFEEMRRISSELSKGFQQVRMDFYEVDGKVYFGEFTFYSGGGFEPFKPDKWEQRLGDWINIGE